MLTDGAAKKSRQVKSEKEYFVDWKKTRCGGPTFSAVWCSCFFALRLGGPKTGFLHSCIWSSPRGAELFQQTCRQKQGRVVVSEGHGPRHRWWVPCLGKHTRGKRNITDYVPTFADFNFCKILEVGQTCVPTFTFTFTLEIEDESGLYC